MRNQRTQILPRLVLAGLALVVMLLLSAPSALASEGCPNEAVRAESSINPTTHEPYDIGLPECRAYEMVSPLEKQQHDAITIRSPLPVSVSPDGTAVQWSSQGAYAGAENYQLHTNAPGNPYVAQRTASGWTTRSGYPPSAMIEYPFFDFQSSGQYSLDLSRESVCGTGTLTGGHQGPTIRCALREPDNSWLTTPNYSDLTGQNFDGVQVVGASRSTEDVVFAGAEGQPFLPADTSGGSCNRGRCGGLYEVSGVGSAMPALRLVNVDNAGNMIGPNDPAELGAGERSAQHAVSADGSRIYFTATPVGGVPTLFVRINGDETLAISNPSPSECTRCIQEAVEGEPETSEAAPGTYQGASADGTKVFFTTDQQLVNGDTDSTADLYEYSFDNAPGHRLTQISRGGLVVLW